MTANGLDRRSVLTGLTGVAGLGLASLAGCSSPAPGAEATTADLGVTVTDQRGSRVIVAAPAQRFVTVPMPAAAMLVAVDGGPSHLVGMQDSSYQALRDGILAQLFPEALSIRHDVATADFAPNVESVLSLRPDVVVQWADQGAGVIAPLEHAGLTVLGLKYGTQQDLVTWVTLFATLLGKPDRARAITQAMDASRAAVQQMPRTGPAPKILYFNRYASGLKVAGASTFNDEYIKLVGGTNPAGSGAGSGMVGVNVEQVITWDPDVILLGNFDGAMPSDVYASAPLTRVSAVRAKRVYKVPLGGYRWDPPSHESPLMWRWLSMVAFPAATPFDLRGEIDRYFTLYYGRTPTAAQIRTMLWSDANGGSAAYRQFNVS